MSIPHIILLRAKAATALAHLSHHNFVCLSICLSITWVNQSKTVQAKITKSSPSAAWKTIVSETVKLFHKFEGKGQTNESTK